MFLPLQLEGEEALKHRSVGPRGSVRVRVFRVQFSVLDRKYTFFGKFGLKNQNGQLKLKFDTWTNSNMQNSVMMFNFSSFACSVFLLSVVSDLRSETKGSRFESGCQLCAEVSSLQ